MEPIIEKQITHDKLLEKGYKPLTKEELSSLIIGNTVYGDYEYSGHRVFSSYMAEDGSIEGENDWGSHESGHWSIDEAGVLSVEWNGYWEAWSGIAFQVEHEIKFYDLENGKWRTTFHKILKGEHELKINGV